MSKTDKPVASARSRRAFLKSSTAAVVGGSLLTQMGPLPGAYAGGDDLIRVGLIGCGGRGTGAAQQALKTNGSVKLVAMGDAFRDQLENSLHQLKSNSSGVADRVAVDPERCFAGFDTYQKVIDAGVDLVILATPPGFRPLHFEAAVKADKHVFTEKPLAVDAPGVRLVLAMTEEAKRKGLAVGVGLQRHHQQHYLDALAKVRDGAIGDVTYSRVYWNGAGVWDPRKTREECRSEMEYQMRNWYYYNWLCGDHIVEQHIHNLDVSNWFVGAHPMVAQGQGGREVRTDPKYGEIYDHHFVEFTYENGVTMLSQCRHMPGCWSNVSEHIHGTKGVLQLDDRQARITGPHEWTGRRGPDPYQVEHDDLFASIRSGQPINEGQNGALSTMTAILGRMATYSGRTVRWEEAIHSEISLMPKQYAWDAQPPTMPDEQGRYAIAIPGVTQVV